jgi:hypothetical protein
VRKIWAVGSGVASPLEHLGRAERFPRASANGLGAAVGLARGRRLDQRGRRVVRRVYEVVAGQKPLVRGRGCPPLQPASLHVHQIPRVARV